GADLLHDVSGGGMAGGCFFQGEDGIRDFHVTGVQTCALPIWQISAAQLRDCSQSWAPTDGLIRQICCGEKLISSAPSNGSDDPRSEERRVGKECRYPGWPAQ